MCLLRFRNKTDDDDDEEASHWTMRWSPGDCYSEETSRRSVFSMEWLCFLEKEEEEEEAKTIWFIVDEKFMEETPP